MNFVWQDVRLGIFYGKKRISFGGMRILLKRRFGLVFICALVRTFQEEVLLIVSEKRIVSSLKAKK